MHYSTQTAFDANPLNGGYEDVFYAKLPEGAVVVGAAVDVPPTRAHQSTSYTILDWMEDPDGLGIDDFACLKIYAILYQHGVRDGGAFPINQSALASAVFMSRPKVNRALKRLVDAGLLSMARTFVRQPGGGARRDMNVYRVEQAPINEAFARVSAKKARIPFEPEPGGPAFRKAAAKSSCSNLNSGSDLQERPHNCDPGQMFESEQQAPRTRCSDLNSGARGASEPCAHAPALPAPAVPKGGFTCENADAAADWLASPARARKKREGAVEDRIYINKNNNNYYSFILSSSSIATSGFEQGSEAMGAVELTAEELSVLANIVSTSKKASLVTGRFVIETARSLKARLDEGLAPAWIQRVWERYVSEVADLNAGAAAIKYESFPANWLARADLVAAASLRAAAEDALAGCLPDFAPEGLLDGASRDDLAVIAASSFMVDVPDELAARLARARARAKVDAARKAAPASPAPCDVSEADIELRPIGDGWMFRVTAAARRALGSACRNWKGDWTAVGMAADGAAREVAASLALGRVRAALAQGGVL